MSRAAGLLLSFLPALSAMLGCERAPERTPTGNDVVFFLIDTLRADHLGCYGYDRATSPHIDRLAAAGARIARATAQSSWTAPSMVSLMLSRHVGVDFVRMPAGTTLAERLRAAGYETTALQFNILLDRGAGHERGFDEYLVEPDVDQMLAAIDRKGERPRFLYIHLVAPHDPYAPARVFDVFQPRALPETQRSDFARYLRELDGDLSEAELAAAVEQAAASMAADIARYDGEILQVDDAVGRIVQRVRQAGRIDRTVFVLGADHGECLWEHREARAVLGTGPVPELRKAFKMSHSSLVCEGLLHVPMIFSGPGVPQGVVLDGLAENIDLGPTVLDLLGLELPRGIDGESLLPALREAADGGAPRGRDLVFANTTVFTAARTRSGYKLIVPHLAGGPDPRQFFHLATDPRERAPAAEEGAAFEGLSGAIESFRRSALRAENGEDEIDSEIGRRMRQLGYLGDGR